MNLKEALLMLVFEFGDLIEFSGALPNFPPCSIFHLFTFTLERLIVSSSYLYQKDQRALHRNFDNFKCIAVSPFNTVCYSLSLRIWTAAYRRKLPST